MDAEMKHQPRRVRIGWWILLMIAGMMILNGVGWFFGGPATTPANMAKAADMPVDQFQARFAGVVNYHQRTTRQVAVWYTVFGAMALVITIAGLRHGSRWSWRASWAIMAAPTLIGLVYAEGIRVGGESAVLLTFGALALVGLMLARQGSGYS